MIDLHAHSSISDGVDEPADLMRLAEKAGVTVMALTDHDTLAGVDAARAAAPEHGITLIPGVELSVDHGPFKIHMLVYFVEPGIGPIQDRLEDLRRGRDERNVQIIAKLNELGYRITMEDVKRQAKGPSVGRPHLADALIEAGYFSQRDEVFEDLLRDGGRAYLPRTRLTALDAISLAREGGGVPVIAHPATIRATADEYDTLFRELTDAGLGGIEAHHSMHDPALREHLTKVAHGLGLAATGGSDYHGAGKRPYQLGVGTGDLRTPRSALHELLEQQSR